MFVDIFSQLTLCTSLTTVFILAVKKLLGHKMSPKLNYMIWLLILTQLLIPYRLDFEFDYVQVELMSVSEGFDSLPITEPTESLETNPQKKQVILVVWFMGFLGLVMVYGVAAFRQRKTYVLTKDYDGVCYRVKRQLHMSRTVRMAYSDVGTSPYVTGLIKPILVVPRTITGISSLSLEMMFYHELMHIKKHDLFWKYVFVMMTMIFWYNPLVWVAYKVFSIDQELACDYEVMKHLGHKYTMSYGKALLDFLEITQAEPFVFSNTYVKKSMIKRRINMLTQLKNDTIKRKLLINSVLLLGSIFLILSGPSLALDNLNSSLDQSNEYAWPTESKTIVRSYGKWNLGFHNGIDIEGDIGDDIYAAADGTVIATGHKGTFGKYIIIAHDHDLVTHYYHNDKVKVMAGDQVSKGQVIALLGETGRSVTRSLHFVVKRDGHDVDPMVLYGE